MNKLFSRLSTLLSLPTAKTEAHSLPVNDILYSMPTLSGDNIAYQQPVSTENAPQFHEDMWCQLEFFPSSALGYIQSKLSEYSDFELKNRTESGWRDTYVRHITRTSFEITPTVLETMTPASLQPAPILTTTTALLGQVKQGFSLPLAEGALIYGVTQHENVVTLAASVYADEGNQALTQFFININQTHRFILVDWRAQMLMMTENQEISLWKPS